MVIILARKFLCILLVLEVACSFLQFWSRHSPQCRIFYHYTFTCRLETANLLVKRHSGEKFMDVRLLQVFLMITRIYLPQMQKIAQVGHVRTRKPASSDRFTVKSQNRNLKFWGFSRRKSVLDMITNFIFSLSYKRNFSLFRSRLYLSLLSINLHTNIPHEYTIFLF